MNITFNSICEHFGIDVNKFESGSTIEEKSDIAYSKLKLVIKYLNSGWKPDWSDVNQIKYYPYFKLDKKENKFICYKYGDYALFPVVGSRLVYKSKLLAELVVVNFLDIYNDYLTY